MRATATSGRAWGIMGVVVLILGISGPFQTFEYLALGPRMAYWAVMGVASFGVGSFFGTWASTFAERHSFVPMAKFVFTGIGSGIPVAICVIGLNILALDGVFNNLEGMLMLAGYCLGISMAISGLFMIVAHHKTQPDALLPARIVNRLPVEKRGNLLSLSVQDHYVEVVTSRGKHLVLVRLSDAMEEAAGTPGMQIHRSHWVAMDAVKSVIRRDGKIIIQTHHDNELPVSRTYVGKLKEAGLLV